MRNWHGVAATLCVVLSMACSASDAPGGEGASAGRGGAAGSPSAGGAAQSGNAGSAPLGNSGSTASAGTSGSTNAGSSGAAGATAGSGGGAGGVAGSSTGAGGVAGSSNGGAANSGAAGAGTAGASSVVPNVQGTPECAAFCTKLAKCPGAMCDTFDCRIMPGSCAAEARAMLTCTTNTGKFMCEGNGLYEVTDECPRMPDLCK